MHDVRRVVKRNLCGNVDREGLCGRELLSNTRLCTISLTEVRSSWFSNLLYHLQTLSGCPHLLLWLFWLSANLGTHPSIDSSPNILISIDDKDRKWEKFISHLINQYFLLYRCSPIQSNKTWSDAFERVASARCDFASKDGHVIAICWVRGVEGRQCIAMFSF